MAAPRVVLVDGSSYFYRAFFAIRGLATSRGAPTNAAYGFTTMIRKVLRDLAPDYAAVVFDAWAPTFRSEMYPAYKATREEMPEDLAAQIPAIKRIPPAYRIFTVEQAGFEADDIIGTIARRAEREKCEVVIITADKDLMQLVTRAAKAKGEPGTVIFDDRSDRWIGVDEVREKFGVAPDRVIDVLALIGDTSDNVPGVTGIGEKTAPTLIAKHGTVEEILANLPAVEPERIRKKLEEGRDDAVLSKKLVTIVTDVPLTWTLDDLKPGEPDRDALKAIFGELEFTQFLREVEPAESASPKPEGKHRAILTEADLKRAAASWKAADLLAFDTETDSTVAMRARLVGVSVCAKEGEAAYIPVGHAYMGAPKQVSIETLRKHLGPILANPNVPKAAQNAKYDLLVLRRHGFEVAGLATDTLLASYVLDPESPHGLDALALRYLEHKMLGYEEVTGKGKHQVTFDMVPVDRATEYSADDAEVTWRLARKFPPMLEEAGLDALLRDVEVPLVDVLAAMETAGVLIDAKALGKISKELDKRAKELLKEAHRVAGVEFNLDSPKQLREILFRKLGLKPGKQTKTGFSTDAVVLEKLAEEHELPRVILEYRTVAKIKSTYVDALPKMVHPETGRIHTSYNQAVAATGRLSSSDPNLQNIPIRTDLGKHIREAFVARKGWRLVSADYSQIELRVLAHLSGDAALIRAFEEERDIHAATAGEIFGVEPDVVTPEMRRKAKEVNFGVIYGLTAFGLAQRLSIPPPEAQQIVDKYFARYPGIRGYLDGVLEGARRDGYVTTILNRRRYVRDVTSRNASVRARAEREATNAPIQGSAADIMKVAMIRAHRRMVTEKREAVLTLQVHDELVAESPKGEEEAMTRLLKEEMEGAMALKVPLRAQIGSGANWAETGH